LNIGRGLGLPADRLRAVKPGETIHLGKFTLRFIASRHSPTPYSDGHGLEPITSPLVPPRHVTAWREGEVWSLAVSHASGASFLVHGSAGYLPGMLSGVRADTVFLGTGTLGKKDAAYRAAYWQEVVKTVGARRVIPIHWDDFTLSLDEPLQAAPYLLDDVDLVMRDLGTRTRQDGIDLRLPPLFVPFLP
jgi:L-ascorbate metabolism protein UlaG (beta-lactamase superfamily)